MTVHDTFHRGETYAMSGEFLTGMEALERYEQRFGMVHGKTDSVVTNKEDFLAILLLTPELNDCLFCF